MLGGPGVQEKRLDLTGHHGAQILTGRVAGLEGRTRNKLAISTHFRSVANKTGIVIQ